MTILARCESVELVKIDPLGHVEEFRATLKAERPYLELKVCHTSNLWTAGAWYEVNIIPKGEHRVSDSH